MSFRFFRLSILFAHYSRSDGELRAIAEDYAYDNAKFVKTVVAAWDKLTTADRWARVDYVLTFLKILSSFSKIYSMHEVFMVFSGSWALQRMCATSLRAEFVSLTAMFTSLAASPRTQHDLLLSFFIFLDFTPECHNFF